jgi:hypothetical protein
MGGEIETSTTTEYLNPATGEWEREPMPGCQFIRGVVTAERGAPIAAVHGPFDWDGETMEVGRG